ncbi:hypothetical protein [Burkholderia stagnalis]|nr:hypothetical protein [Burkholderia stagnalis]
MQESQEMPLPEWLVRMLCKLVAFGAALRRPEVQAVLAEGGRALHP